MTLLLTDLSQGRRGVDRTAKRVVVVDNDPDAVDLVVTDLQYEGHVIVGTVYDARSGIEVCRLTAPDVVVVDLRMAPGPNGVEVVRAIRDQAGVRCIVYTNYNDSRVRRVVEGLGAVYLMKGELATLRRAVLG